MIYGKVWGSVRPLFDKSNVIINAIDVAASFKCSKHKHDHRYNMFYVSKGLLLIQVWKKDYDLVDTTLLYPGQSTIVAPGEYHEFAAVESTIGIEVYWVEIDDRDIIRENCGGRIKEDNKESV